MAVIAVAVTPVPVLLVLVVVLLVPVLLVLVVVLVVAMQATSKDLGNSHFAPLNFSSWELFPGH